MKTPCKSGVTEQKPWLHVVMTSLGESSMLFKRTCKIFTKIKATVVLLLFDKGAQPM